MTTSLTSANEIIRITVNATALKVTEVTFHEDARSFVAVFYDAAGTVQTSGRFSYIDTHGDAITTSRSFLLQPGMSVPITLRDDKSLTAIRKIYFASTVVNGIVEIISSEVG